MRILTLLIAGCVTKTITVTKTNTPSDPATDPTPTTHTTPDPTTPTPTTPTTTPTDTGSSVTTTPTTLPTTVRIATWNVETLGQPGTDQYDAVRDVLLRIDADVVGLNEIDYGEEDYVRTLAGELGLSTVVVSDTNPFGGLHNAIMTRLVVDGSTIFTSPDLSGDPDADDVTRWPVGVVVETAGGTLGIVSEHWKSGFEVIDEFRRVMDCVRVGQAAEALVADGVVTMGDMNAEIGESTVVDTWYYLPTNAPFDYILGSDIQDRLDNGGIPDDAFAPLIDAGLAKVPAAQRDGNLATRDVSGRIIDHLFASPAVHVEGAEVYDSRDDSLPGLTLHNDPPDVDATATGSDHFPVFADVTVSP